MYPFPKFGFYKPDPRWVGNFSFNQVFVGFICQITITRYLYVKKHGFRKRELIDLG